MKTQGVQGASKSGDNADLKGWLGAAPENSWAQTWAESWLLAQEVPLPGQQILHSVASTADLHEVNALKVNPDLGLFVSF